MSKNQVKTASVLAFERKLSNSDGIMFAGEWATIGQADSLWQPIVVQEKAVRGTISNRLSDAIAKSGLKIDAEVQKANLQRVDVAALPFESDTLKLSFTLRVLGNLSTPSVCNDQDYQAALSGVIESYIAEHGFRELATRYAHNLVNGRVLWRNRVGAEASRVEITHEDNRWIFNAEDYSLREFSQPAGDLLALATALEKGLNGALSSAFRVDIYARLGHGQEVFPSQELILDTGSAKSKVLYQVNGVAGMHSQKIGNALRTIDTWYPGATKPIAVETYGSVTSEGTAYRVPKEKMDFYSLLDNWVTKGIVPDTEQQHFVMAVMIRGGVFGEKAEKG